MIDNEAQLVKRRARHGRLKRRDVSFIKDIVLIMIPVLSFALTAGLAVTPPVLKLLTPNRSILTASFQAAPSNALSALVSNSGGRPGSIRGATIDLPGGQKDIHYQFSLSVVTAGQTGAELIPAEGVSLVRFERSTSEVSLRYFLMVGGKPHDLELPDIAVRRAWIDTATADKSEKECSITFSYSNFDGSSDSSGQNMACSLLRNLLVRWEQESPVK